MIKIIGTKLIALLALFFILNSVLFGSWFLWTVPMKEQAELKLNGINAEISKLHSSITNIKDELEYYDTNKNKFQTLSNTGYMKEQNRTDIASELENMRKNSHIQKLSYDISDTITLEHKTVDKAKHRLIKRRITLEEITAFFDTDIYKFLYELNENFPGHTRIITVDIKRTQPKEFSNIINRLTNGGEEHFVTSDITLDWYALVKLPEVKPLPILPQ